MGSKEERRRLSKAAWRRVTEKDREALDVSGDFLELSMLEHHSAADGEGGDAQALALMALAAAAQKQAYIQQLQYQEQRVANLLAFGALPEMGFPLVLKQQAVQAAADMLGLSEPVDEPEEAGSHGLL